MREKMSAYFIPFQDDEANVFDSPVPERLFHGTTLENYNSISESGPDINLSRECLDFGPAFYTSRSMSQAYKWANAKSGVVIEFSIHAREWEALLRQNVSGKQWEDLVTECLNGQINGGYCDVREGECCKNPSEVKKGERPHGFGSQTALMTRRALQVIRLADTFQARNKL